MADSDVHTPLNGQHYTSDGLTIRELEFCSKINLRGNMAEISDSVTGIVGVATAIEANRYVTSAGSTMYWLGPDERLLHASGADAESIVAQLRNHLPDGSSAVVDVSDYYTVVQVAGDKAVAALASGTPFDLHSSVFGPGQCAQTRFGNASVLLSCRANNTYDLQVRWSFAEYLWKYLCRVSNYV